MSELDTKICVLCNLLLSLEECATIKEKGLRTFTQISKQRKDGHDKLLSKLTTMHIHKSCSKNYLLNTHKPFKPSIFRQRESGFPFDRLCCICAEDIGTSGEPTDVKKAAFVKIRIVQALQEFSSPAGQVIIDRIANVDLEECNARYHRPCLRSLVYPKDYPEFHATYTAMQVIYDYIDTNEDSHFFLKELIRILPDYIPDEDTIKKQLKEKYGHRMIITETPNGHSVLSLSTSDSLTIEDSILSINCQGDNLSIVRKAAQIVREDLCQENISIPESLQCFVRALSAKKSQEINKKAMVLAKSVASLSKEVG